MFDEERRVPERRRSAAGAFVSDLRDLKIGDHVVHVDHGIGVFVGLREIGVAGSGAEQEFLELRYAGDDKLFVPVERLDLIQKYSGGARPSLDRLGAPRGNGPRPASARPCGTWPRSCCGSMPPANPFRVMPSVPIRTGKPSSRTRSRTS